MYIFEYESHADNTQSKSTQYPSIETETMNVSGRNLQYLDHFFFSHETTKLRRAIAA